MLLSDRVIRRFLLAHVVDGSAVLDVGCGTGWAALLIARERPGCLVHGADSDAGVVHALNRRTRRSRKTRGVHCYPCAAEDLRRTFGQGRYDVATSVHALHHYRDPYAALRNMRAVLRRGGRALLAEFDPDYGETLDDCPRFSLAKLVWLCEDAGFRVTAADRKRPGVLLVTAERI